MRLSLKILIALIVIFALICGIIYLLLISVGKSIIIAELEALTHRKVSVGYFGLTPPFRLELRKLDIEGLLKADSIFISPSVPGFLAGNIAFNAVRIIRPVLVLEKVAPGTQESTSVTTALPPGDGPASTAVKQPKQEESMRLVFKRLKIKEGDIDFIDRTVGKDGLKITVKDIDFNITNLYLFPRSVIMNFELKAKIPWQQSSEEGRIEAQGWLNLQKKDMQAALKVEAIDGIYLYPYYSNWVDLEKARIEKAKLNFSTDIQALNNDLVAMCRLELTDIVRKPRPSEETAEKAERITDAVLDILRSLDQGKIVLDFNIRTKMDRPEFGLGSIRMAFEDKLAQGRKDGLKPQDVLIFPSKLIVLTIKSLTDITTAVITGSVNAGKEVGKVVRDTIKK